MKNERLESICVLKSFFLFLVFEKAIQFFRKAACIELLKNSDIEYEFRTTITENFHTVDDIEKLAEWIQGAKHYFLQNFVDSGQLIDSSCKDVSKATMYEMLEKAKKYIPNAQIRGI